jgi:hypothetical protein
MPRQEKMLAPKKRGRKPTGKGLTVGVRCQPELLTAIDAARVDEADNPSRPEMLRRVAVEALKRRGFIAK